MPVLMLLRHAKAEATGACDDFERELTKGGETDAARLGKYLRRVGYIPELAVVSPARRTLRTFETIAARSGADITARPERDLYDATPEEILAVIAAAGDAAGGRRLERLMVVGHNPGIMEVAVSLAGDGDRADLERMRSRFPPCGLAVLTFADDGWGELRTGTGRLETFVTPEDTASER